MELRHLRYFVVVAEEQNISRAAQRLAMSQPPLTRQIKQLEEEVGAKLLHRGARGVELTDAGKVFLADARRVLLDVDHASARARRAGVGAAGRIDVAVFGTGIFGAIPRLLRAHRRAHPEVEVVLHTMPKAEQIEALEHKRISLAFNRLMRPTPGITSEVLLIEPLFVALPSEHRLAGRAALQMGELEAEPMVLFPTGYRPSFIDSVRDMCVAAGFVPRVAAHVDDVVHGIALVAAGNGICIVPWSATNLQIPGLTYVPLYGEPMPSVDLCCVTRTGDRSPVLLSLLESLRQGSPAIGAERQAHLAEVVARARAADEGA